MYNEYIGGKSVYLRHPNNDDVTGKWHEWLSDWETTMYMSDRFWPNCKESQMDFYDSILLDKSRLVLSAVLKSNEKHIGVVSLSGINWVHQYADVAILIGEKEYRSGSIAAEIFSLILKVAFLKFNLRNVKSAYCSSNKGSQALHRMFKFKSVGSYEELLVVNGKSEALNVEILSKESWVSRNPL